MLYNDNDDDIHNIIVVSMYDLYIHGIHITHASSTPVLRFLSGERASVVIIAYHYWYSRAYKYLLGINRVQLVRPRNPSKYVLLLLLNYNS